MNISLKFEEIQLNIKDIQKSISNLRTTHVESDDFYKKMVELTNDHPDAYELIQAMIMLFSKMETSNKIFKEHVIEYSLNGLELKRNALEIIAEQDMIIIDILSKLEMCQTKMLAVENSSTEPKKDNTPGLWAHFNNYVSNPKNFGKVLFGVSSIVIFLTIMFMEANKPKLLHDSINTTIKTIQGEQVETQPESK